MQPSDHLRSFLTATGLGAGDPEFEGTPERVAELLAGFVPQPVRAPSICATTVRAPVVVSGLRFHSLCAHHLLPFFGTVAVGYLPRDRMVGFGSVPRLVEDLSRRAQLQERLGTQILAELVGWLAPEAAVVAIRARHLCMEMRGARAEGEVFTLAVHGTPDRALLDEVRGR
jgi:GTP cyclohydrolase I